MNNFLKTGLLMQFCQILLVGIGIVIYTLLTISWTLNLIALIIFTVFNLISVIFIIIGLFTYGFNN